MSIMTQASVAELNVKTNCTDEELVRLVLTQNWYEVGENMAWY